MQVANITAVSGFLQNEGSDENNGIETLWLERLRPLIGPRLFVNYRPWWTDWRDHAQAVWRYTRRATCGPRPISPDEVGVAVFGYSYGGGYGAVRLARELGKRGLSVSHLLLCDPVLHHGWPLRCLRRVPSAWSLTSWPVIHLPKNVKPQGVEHWYQRNRDWSHLASWPQGHRVRLHDGTPVVGRQVNTGVTHDHMDNHPAFLARCAEVAEMLHRRVEHASEHSPQHLPSEANR